MADIEISKDINLVILNNGFDIYIREYRLGNGDHLRYQRFVDLPALDAWKVMTSEETYGKVDIGKFCEIKYIEKLIRLENFRIITA